MLAGKQQARLQRLELESCIDQCQSEGHGGIDKSGIRSQIGVQI